jgi:hypothetical protein
MLKILLRHFCNLLVAHFLMLLPVAMAGLQAFTAMIGVPFVGPEIAGPAQ